MITRIHHAKINNFIIEKVLDDGKLTHFIVCDKNREKFSSEKFQRADLAIQWANDNFKEIR